MVFEAVSFNESECGSKIKGSKKRFLWTFRIEGVVNTVELIASFISGKRKVLHNDRQIYTEKELLNVNFEFVHKIDNHMFRITQDKNKFDMVVDGCTFDDWLRNRGFNRAEKKKPMNFEPQEKPASDPFAEFGVLSKKSSSKQNDYNAFGNFQDFGFSSAPDKSKFVSASNSTVQQPRNQSFEDIFSNPPPKQQGISSHTDFVFPSSTQNPQKPPQKPNNSVDLLDLL